MDNINCEKIEEITGVLESAICFRLAVDDPRPMNDAEYDLAAELSRSDLGRDVVKDSLSYATSKGAIHAYARMSVSARTLVKAYRELKGS